MLPKRSFKGGVHPLHLEKAGKSLTSNKAIRDFIPDTVAIPMAMHMGAPSIPLVNKGDRVKLGQVIGEPVGFLGLPVHSSVSGEVVAVEPRIQLGSSAVTCVVINNDFNDSWSDEIKVTEM